MEKDTHKSGFVQTKETDKKAKRIMNKVLQDQLFRFHNTISLWKTAVEEFENPQFPMNVDLIRVYNDAVLDGHLSALIESRKQKTTGSDFKIVDDKGDEIEEQTAMIEKQWFMDAMNHALDSKFFGFSLLQFGDRMGRDFKTVDVVPREYVLQQKSLVKTSPNVFTGKPFKSFAGWVLPAGNPCDLGLLAKAVPLTVYKKTALGAWADFTDIYGVPLRVGKTNVRDDETRENMAEMLENMRASTWAVVDTDDVVEMVSGTSTDAYQTFQNQIELLNNELSKLMVGSTMTMDSGSSRSQSETHENTTNQIAKADARWMEHWCNTEFIPFLNSYHGFKITGKFKFDTTEVLTIAEQFDIDKELLKHYKVPASYIVEKYGTPVDEKDGNDVEPAKNNDDVQK